MMLIYGYDTILAYRLDTHMQGLMHEIGPSYQASLDLISKHSESWPSDELHFTFYFSSRHFVCFFFLFTLYPS